MHVLLAVCMLDAPVSGGVMAAETATLTFMVCVVSQMVYFIGLFFMKFILVVKTLMIIPSLHAHTLW